MMYFTQGFLQGINRHRLLLYNGCENRNGSEYVMLTGYKYNVNNYALKNKKSNCIVCMHNVQHVLGNPVLQVHMVDNVFLLGKNLFI